MWKWLGRFESRVWEIEYQSDCRRSFWYAVSVVDRVVKQDSDRLWADENCENVRDLDPACIKVRNTKVVGDASGFTSDANLLTTDKQTVVCPPRLDPVSLLSVVRSSDWGSGKITWEGRCRYLSSVRATKSFFFLPCLWICSDKQQWEEGWPCWVCSKTPA